LCRKGAWWCTWLCGSPGGSFKSAGQAQRFLSTHDQINNLFPLRRDHVTATEYRAARTRAFELWAEVSGVAAAA
jgi:putative transposase